MNLTPGPKAKTRMAMNKPTFHRIFCGCLALACAVGLPLLAAQAQAQAQAQAPAARAKPAPAGGGRQQFPPDHPAFRFSLPATWTVDRGNDDKATLICNVIGRGDIGLLCMGVSNVFALDDFARILPGLAQEHLELLGITDCKVFSKRNAQAGAMT